MTDRGELSIQQLEAHLRAAQAKPAAQLGPGHHQGAARAHHPGLADAAAAGGGQHLDPIHAAGFAEGPQQHRRLEALLPGVHRAGLVEIGNAHQIRELLAPDVTAVLGAAAAAAVEHRVGELAAEDQHLAAGGGNRFAGGGGFSLHPLVDLAADRGTQVERSGRFSLAQGIGTGGDRLSAQGGLRPTGRHLTAHHAGQIQLQRQVVDRLQGRTVEAHLQGAAVTALLQLKVAAGCLRRRRRCFQPERSDTAR